MSEPLNGSAGTSSAGSGFDFFAEQIPVDETIGPVGDVIDGEIVDEEQKPRSRLKTGHTFREPTAKSDTPRSTPPSLDDWMDFISRVLIRAATDFYIDAAFRDIDEEWLTDREVDRIKLSEPERNRIAKPLAELAHKTKFTRKHGRSIIAAAGSIDSVIQLGMWFSRVNRIANKYRQLGLANPAQPRRGTTKRNAFVPPATEESGNVGTGQGSPEGNGRPHWRPNIAGEVQFPDAG